MPAKYFAFDTETTGLDPHMGDQILSYAFIVLDENLVELARRQRYFFPSEGMEVAEAAAKVNGFTVDEWTKRGALPQSDLASQLSRDWGDCSVKRLMPLGHNYAFDQAFLKKSADPKALYAALSYHFVDTMILAIAIDQAKGTKGTYKLVDLCARYGVELVNAHDSLGDIEATVGLYRKLIEVLRGAEAPQAAPRGFLTKLASGDFEFRFGKHKGRCTVSADVPQDYLEWVLGNIDSLTPEERQHLEELV